MPELPESAVVALLAARGRRRRLDAGQVLFHEADDSSAVYCCLSGRIRLVVSGAGGRELLLDIQRAGDVFGELSAIDGQGRSTSAIAMEPSTVVELSGGDFLAAIRLSPEVALVSMRGLVRQLRRANVRICSGETEHVAPRAARLLLELAERFGPDEPGATPSLHMTQADLAEWLGATREATARALAALRRAGVISTGRSVITVNDRSELVRLASTR